MQLEREEKPAAAPKVPGGQKKLEPRVQYEPIGHVVQDAEPGDVEKAPDGHVAQDARDVKPSAGP